jgi:hypothetical protein
MAVRALIVACAFCSSATAETKLTKAKPGYDQVELFAAEAAEQIEILARAKDKSEITVRIRNRTDKPLAIKPPKAFAAAPILAQAPGGGNAIFGVGPGGFPGGGGGGGGGAAQGVGGPFGGGGGMMNGGGLNNPFGGGGGNMFGAGGGRRGGPGGFFNIPPEKTVKIKLKSVCLEFGKPEPNAKIPYRLIKLEKLSSQPAVAELMDAFRTGRISQRVVQLAAWHLANGKTWRELSQLEYREATGRRRPQYSQRELQFAKQLVEQLPSIKNGKNAPAQSPGELTLQQQ